MTVHYSHEWAVFESYQRQFDMMINSVRDSDLGTVTRGQQDGDKVMMKP